MFYSAGQEWAIFDRPAGAAKCKSFVQAAGNAHLLDQEIEDGDYDGDWFYVDEQ